MLLIDGKQYDFQPLPQVFFGRHKPLAYVLNPGVASTLSLNFLFYVNQGYRYFDPIHIDRSALALRNLEGSELRPEVLNDFLERAPESFSIVRDPLRRFISTFLSKVMAHADPRYHELRDTLTSIHDVDLSPEADPARSCLAFAKLIGTQAPQDMDTHFRPQYLNLGMGGRFSPDTILRIEDEDALFAFYARWIGEEKAKWFLSLRVNEQLTSFKASDCMSDELEALVRKIYAQDYALFYS